MEKVQDKRNELFQRWEERSRDFIGNFMELFGRDGRLVRSAVRIFFKFRNMFMLSNSFLGTRG